MELDGKRTLVTGAGRGLGLAIAELFAERGAKVACADLDPETAQAAGEKVGGIGITCDVTKPADVQKALSDTAEAFGGIDVLINNAGIEIGKPLPETGDDEFAALMAVNVGGVFYG